MATAASAPSAAAVIAKCSPQRTLPATNKPGTRVAACSLHSTPPDSANEQPRLAGKADFCGVSVTKNNASHGSDAPATKSIFSSMPSGPACNERTSLSQSATPLAASRCRCRFPNCAGPSLHKVTRRLHVNSSKATSNAGSPRPYATNDWSRCSQPSQKGQ